MELTLQEAAVLFEVEAQDIALALEALGRDIPRRLIRRGEAIETYYRREDIEDALSRVAAQLLGFRD